ncbi:MAG TPA: kelch repeat-containing protein, partial [Candidatus Eisenbacteria bacterium]|nr:kelch repeat-containing protein [Candidatus Eisenbacteria bacterium]
MRRALSLVCLALCSGLLGAPAVLAKSEDLGGWLPAATLTTGRAQHTATLLRTGKVLVTGGVDGRGLASATVELFDPIVNHWTEGPEMSVPRTQHTATMLEDGRVLVVGGFRQKDPLGETLSSAELYDPATNRWAPAGSMAFRRARHSAVLLRDGRVLVLGGVSSDPYVWRFPAAA